MSAGFGIKNVIRGGNYLQAKYDATYVYIYVMDFVILANSQNFSTLCTEIVLFSTQTGRFEIEDNSSFRRVAKSSVKKLFPVLLLVLV